MGSEGGSPRSGEGCSTRRHRGSLRALRNRLVLVLVVYFFAGGISQKLIPGVDEIFPFFGWSLFSKVPARAETYAVLIDRHGGRRIDPPAELLRAPEPLARGNRAIARKVVQSLGSAHDGGEAEEVARLRRLLEANYLGDGVSYRVVLESYEPLEKWRTGELLERRTVAAFASGVFE